MRVTSLVAVMVPLPGKIVKNGLLFFERGENLLQTGILHFVIRFSQSSEKALDLRKTDFSERGLVLKGLTNTAENMQSKNFAEKFQTILNFGRINIGTEKSPKFCPSEIYGF